jgi:hypothetical protein
MSVPVEFIFLSTPELNYIKTRQLDYAITQVQQNKQTITIHLENCNFIMFELFGELCHFKVII